MQVSEIRDRSARENFFLLVDPEWRPVGENDVPPMDVVLGLWPIDQDGSVGKFRANPDYLPADEDSVSDPVDAVLRLALRGAAGLEEIQLILRDTMFDVAMADDTRPQEVRSPDDVPCVAVATSAVHLAGVEAAHWQRVDLAGLVALLADGVDVLFNSNGPAAVRLTGDFIRGTTMLDDNELDVPRPDAAGIRFMTADLAAAEETDTGEER